jgi:hypothetical protein
MRAMLDQSHQSQWRETVVSVWLLGHVKNQLSTESKEICLALLTYIIKSRSLV